MAFKYTNSKGKTYYLHTTDPAPKSGSRTPLYFFSPTLRAGTLDAVPQGYEVIESSNGLPVLKKRPATRESSLEGGSEMDTQPSGVKKKPRKKDRRYRQQQVPIRYVGKKRLTSRRKRQDSGLAGDSGTDNTP